MQRAATHYCARCLTPAAPALVECRRCATPFTGAGRFDLIHGPSPSREFRSLFAAGGGCHHRAAR